MPYDIWVYISKCYLAPSVICRGNVQRTSQSSKNEALVLELEKIAGYQREGFWGSWYSCAKKTQLAIRSIVGELWQESRFHLDTGQQREWFTVHSNRAAWHWGTSSKSERPVWIWNFLSSGDKSFLLYKGARRYPPCRAARCLQLTWVKHSRQPTGSENSLRRVAIIPFISVAPFFWVALSFLENLSLGSSSSAHALNMNAFQLPSVLFVLTLSGNLIQNPDFCPNLSNCFLAWTIFQHFSWASNPTCY